MIREEEDDPGGVWPPGVIAIVADLGSASEWPVAINEIVEARAAVVDSPRAVSAVFRLGGRVSDHLSGEIARAWWPRPGVPADAGYEAADEPRHDAWRAGVWAAADVRWGSQHLAATRADSAAHQVVAEAVACAEAALRLARTELTRLGAERAVAILDRLALPGEVDAAAVADAERVSLELANDDLLGGEASR